MANYSIKELENLSGIKAHTIRIWEKRYNLIEPSRTDTNIRYYCDKDLKRLLNVAILNRQGIKISEIAKLKDDELAERVVNMATDTGDAERNIEQLVIAMIDMDELKFDRILSRYIMNKGFENAVVKVFFPFFERIGILWQTGSINPAHEHFVSNLFRQKLMVAIDNIMVTDNQNAKKFILFLPEGEYHELGLLFYNYLIRKSGQKVFYLGSSVPFNDVVETSKMVDADYLFTTITALLSRDDTIKYLKNLSKTFPLQKIFVTGQQIEQMLKQPPSNVVKITSPHDFIENLKSVV